jgi:hypothetical protein
MLPELERSWSLQTEADKEARAPNLGRMPANQFCVRENRRVELRLAYMQKARSCHTLHTPDGTSPCDANWLHLPVPSRLIAFKDTKAFCSSEPIRISVRHSVQSHRAGDSVVNAKCAWEESVLGKLPLEGNSPLTAKSLSANTV